MALTIGELVGYIRADGSDFNRNLARAELRMQGFRLDVNGRLRDVRGRFVTESRVMGRALADGFSDAERAGTRITTVYSSVADAQARAMRAQADQAAAAQRRLSVQFRTAMGQARNLLDRMPTSQLAGIAAGFGGIAMSIGKAGAMLGAAAPAAAGLVATLANIAPAAAVAVSGMLAMKLASATVKVGMLGVEDAVSAALDPEKAAEFEEALKKLSPEARAFAKEIKAMAPELRKLQQGVQNRLFQDWSTSLRETATVVLPVLRNGLNSTATTLNRMGHGVMAAAQELAANGTLGRAISSASSGLAGLTRAPGQIVTGLGQIAAAAGPSFERLATMAGGALDKLSARFTSAFESGAMQAAIERAISLIGDLVDVAKNVGSILGSVFDAAQATGGGFIGTLKEISGALADAFASPAVQGALRSLFETMSTLAKTVGPLLASALQTLAPVFEILGPPVQELIRALGKGLAPVIKGLKPVLAAAASAFGSLISALAPLLPVAGELIAALLPALIPLFDTLGRIFEAAAPFIAQLAETLGAVLTPLLEGLAPILEALLEPFARLAEDLFPILTAALVELSPGLVELATAFGELMVELAPIIAQILVLTMSLGTTLMPIIAKVAGILAGGLSLALSGLAELLRVVVIPSMKIMAALLGGNFSEAARLAIQHSTNAKERVGELWTQLKLKIVDLSIQLRQAVVQKATEMRDGFVQRITDLRQRAAERISRLPADIRGALGDAQSILYNAGSQIIQGLINGISSKIYALQQKLSSITSMIPDWKGPEAVDKTLLTPAGEQVMGGFMRGIASQVPALRAQLGGITGDIPGMAATGAAGARSAPQPIQILVRGDGSRYGDLLAAEIRRTVQVVGRGSVETAFGTGGG